MSLLMNKLLMCLGLQLAFQAVQAQSDPFLMISTAVQLAAHGIKSQSLPEIPKDQIRGRCEFNTTHCPGAKVVLKDSTGKEVSHQTISSKEGFVFTPLKPGDYFVEVSYPRYNLKPASQRVSTGSEVRIEMQEASK